MTSYKEALHKVLKVSKVNKKKEREVSRLHLYTFSELSSDKFGKLKLEIGQYLKVNEKKQYILTGFNVRRVIPYQKLIFKNKAKFIRKVLNLLTIS